MVFVTFGTRGVPLGKRFEKGAKIYMSHFIQNYKFSCTGRHVELLQNIDILGHPKNSPKAALGRPKGPKHAQKGAFLMCFRYLFGVPCQQ